MSDTDPEATLTRVLCVHTCGGLDHAAWVAIRRRVTEADGTIRHEGHCEGRALTLIERSGGDLEPGWANPCPCWDDVRPSQHDGHCCFSAECEHHETIRASVELLPIGDVPMYAWRGNEW